MERNLMEGIFSLIFPFSERVTIHQTILVFFLEFHQMLAELSKIVVVFFTDFMASLANLIHNRAVFAHDHHSTI